MNKFSFWLKLAVCSNGEPPAAHESTYDGYERTVDTFLHVYSIHCETEEPRNIFVVAHGDTLGATLGGLSKQTLIEAEPCAWVALKKQEGNKFQLLAKSKAEVIDLSS